MRERIPFEGGALRRLQANDTDDFVRTAAANDARLRPFMAFGREQFDEAFTRAYVERKIGAWDTGEFGYALVVNGTFAGFVGLHDVVRGAQASVSYWIDAAYEGKGLIAAAVAALAQAAFSDLHLLQIVLRCKTTNERSRAVAQRLGFSEIGVRRVMFAGLAAPFDEIEYVLHAKTPQR